MKRDLRGFAHGPDKKQEGNDRDRMDLKVPPQPSRQIDGVTLHAFGLREDRLDIESAERDKGQDDSETETDIRHGVDQKRLGRRRTGRWSFRPMCNQEIRCLLYTSPSPRDRTRSRMPSSA